MDKISLLEIEVGGSSEPMDPKFPWLVIRDVMFFRCIIIFPLATGSTWKWWKIFFEETRGVEEDYRIGCVNMIFKHYEHHDPTLGAKLFWKKIDQMDMNQDV